MKFYTHEFMRNQEIRLLQNGVSQESLDSLREQLDASMLNPDYTIVTNFDWSWEQIGSNDRLIDLSREYEEIENQLFAGLGVTREILMGDSMYSGRFLLNC